MNTLPKDMIEKLTDELSPQDFISFCSSNVNLNVTRICKMDDIWAKRLKKDYENLTIRFPNILKNPRKVYLYVFQQLSKTAEKLTEIVLKRYGRVRQFLPPEFSRILYPFFYKLSLDCLNTGTEENEDFGFENRISEGIDNILRQDETIDFAIDYFPGGAYDQEEGELYYYWRNKFGKILQFFVLTVIKNLENYQKTYQN